MDDRQLLRQFTQHNSQEAFAALTARYLSLVYSTCHRELDDADLAEDVTQAVFLILARKAPTLRREVVLSGWLFQTARFAARNARLQEQRRKAHEQKAADTLREQQMETENAAWTDIEPLLNQSLAGLRDGERECVLLRFFQGMSFAEAGVALGLSEEAARKRVTRALEKMCQFFVKNGVIVPSTALAVLLTAHTAKAVPLGLAPAIAQSTAGVLAGHTTTAALTGSHAYQLSEGIIKAMKITQIKAAAGLTIATVVAAAGLTAYAVAGRTVLSASKPGHILQQVPGKTVTAGQIADHCRAAYAALQTYEGTATVDSQSVTGALPWPLQLHNSAAIQFARPGKIHTEVMISAGQTMAYVSDGVGTEESNPAFFGISRNWKKVASTEIAIGGATGVSQNAATTIPALLLGTGWGTPQPLGAGGTLDAEVREDTVDGQLCYVLTGHAAGTGVNTTSLWIDEKTYLLHRLVRDINSTAQTISAGGKPYSMPALKMHNDERFTDERLNQPVPESAFALPPTQ